MVSEKYIIYGAGAQGKGCFEFLKSKGLDSYIHSFCDRNSDNIIQTCGKEVYSYEKAKEFALTFIISLTDTQTIKEVTQMMDADKMRYGFMDELSERAGMDKVSFNREFCAFFHISNMESFFKCAESDVLLNIFWNEKSLFYLFFQKLDISNVIELACGRGRHVPQYIDVAGKITLVDILEQNINFCKDRLKEYHNITYYCNNGYNLQQLDSDKYSSLFCYDSMVHFEMMDIFEYLKDIYRVLQPGGRALLHHSNNDANYKAFFGNATNGRSFMNEKIFAYLAYRSGFMILQQEVIDWGVKDLDCITLLEKPCKEKHEDQ